MCLIVFAWQVVPGVPLIAAANRDEYYARASAPAAPWEENPQIVAGRDLKAGGSWMGITRPESAHEHYPPNITPLRARCSGGALAAEPPEGKAPSRFAALTNIRAPHDFDPAKPSRGMLVSNFLAGSMSAREYVEQIRPGAGAYNGFNLVLCDGAELVWFSNRGDTDPRNGQPLPPGIYGLSNALLDSPWPKVLRTKAQFASLLCLGAPEDAYFEMLADTTRAPDQRLPETGVSIERERVLSAVKIESPDYGTRTSTVVKLYATAPAELHEVEVV
ncbi:NRDE family protein [Pseudoduganella chitinolytica]|uniref:NRDE family protein n=1 Tax=Pseudoduganella chitinolytica TaxID=34070 RepID=A0ABY8BFA4_9BURK|nr:NRDE family protein [Pseudoduganella chitinolytica]WEF34580.1 NRDE family protein [Pseudoduganella chitinolytica]